MAWKSCLFFASIFLNSFHLGFQEGQEVICKFEDYYAITAHNQIQLECVGLGFKGQVFNDEILNSTPKYTGEICGGDSCTIAAASFYAYGNITHDPAADLVIAENTFRFLPNLTKLTLGSQLLPNANKSIRSLVISEDEFLHTSLLRSLSIRRLMITSDQFMAISSIPKLETLEIVGSDLKEISWCMFRGLNYLEYLTLRDCAIDHLHPAAFDILTHLKDLDLSYNRIDSIHPRMFKRLRNLENLDLAWNRLTILPPHIFKRSPMVSTVNFENNNIEKINVNTFADLNGQNIWIILSNNLIEYIEPGALRLVTDLNLSNNYISSILDDAFSNYTSITSLDLGYNEISRITIGTFRGAKSLVSLSLRVNEIISIEQGAFDDLVNLQELAISQNRLQRLPHGLFAKNFNLKTVVISGGNNIDDLSRDNFTHCPGFRYIW